MSSKSSRFMQFVYSTLYPVYVLTETWFNSSVFDHEFFPREYIVYRCDRTLVNSKKIVGGGVLIAVHMSIPSELIITSSSLELVCVQVKLHKNILNIFALYVPPDSSLDTYTAYCENVSSIICNLRQNNLAMIIGDFNLPKIHWIPDEDTNCLLPIDVTTLSECLCIDTLLSCGFYQINNIFNVHHRMLDLVFINNLDSFAVSESSEVFADNDVHHKALNIDLDINIIISSNSNSNNVKQYFYDFKNINYIDMNLYLESIDWSNSLMSANPDKCVELFYDILFEAFGRFVRISKCKRFNYPSWFDDNLINLKNRKNKAYVTWKKSKLDCHKLSYYTLLKQFDITYKSAYSNYITNIESSIFSNPKKFWKYINSKKTFNGLPSTMIYNDVNGSNPSEICELFAKYFQDIYKTTAKDKLYDYDTLLSNDQISIPHILPIDIVNALNSFNDGCGPDGIPSLFLKQFNIALAIPLSIIFNKSLITGIFPDRWKVSKIIPIFKKGKRNEITNYRGIAILSSAPKLFEFIVCNHLFFHVKHLIDNNQHGFFRGRSTTTNLLEFTRGVVDAMEVKSQMDTVYIDFSKAFDSLHFDIIIHKLYYFGFSKALLNWLKSYLTERRQYVALDYAKSKFIYVNSGVPQGSHLGPLIFNLFINDISRSIKFSKCLLYADDLKLFRAIHNSDDIDKLQSDINALNSWSLRNKLLLNYEKCKVMTFHRIHKPLVGNYHLNNVSLNRVFEFKDLGITFVPSLSFNYHIDLIIAKASSLLGFIFRVSKEFNDPKIFIQLYCAYVRAQLEYASLVWCPYYASNINRIENIQKKFLIYFACLTRQINFNSNDPFWMQVRNLPSYSERCKQLQVNSLEVRRQIACAKFVSDLLCGKIDSLFILRSINIRVPRSSSRLTDIIEIAFHRTNYGCNEPINLMAKNFNKFVNIFGLNSKYNFKKCLKALL